MSMTPTQRRLLWDMLHSDETSFATTGDGARINGYGSWLHKEGGLVFRVYSFPLYFMRQRGWVETIERNARGTWYRLTDAGRVAAQSLKAEPPKPKANSRSDFGARRRFQ